MQSYLYFSHLKAKKPKKTKTKQSSSLLLYFTAALLSTVPQMSSLYSLSPIPLLHSPKLSPVCLPLHHPTQLLLQSHSGIPLGKFKSVPSLSYLSDCQHRTLLMPSSLEPLSSFDFQDTTPSWCSFHHVCCPHCHLSFHLKVGTACLILGSLVLHTYSLDHLIKSHGF